MEVLRVEHLTVRRGSHVAVDDVSLSVDAGSIAGLIGPNGAGKTSLFDAVCGLGTARAGRVFIGEEDLSRLPAHRRARRGMARTFQRLETFTHLTVTENIRAGAEFRRHRDDTPWKMRCPDALVDWLGLRDVADVRADRLSTGQARLVEFGRALAGGPRLMLLDEPSSGLDHRETEDFARVLAEVRAAGMAILMVEHDMGLVMGVCDVVHVLSLGRLIASGTPAEVQMDASVRSAYLGNDVGEPSSTADAFPLACRERPAEVAPDRTVPPLMALRGVSAGHRGIDVIHDVDLEVREGQIVAVLGPNGSGKSTMLDVISGMLAPSQGRVEFCGRVLSGARPEALALAGVCTVPEGRGIFAGLSVAENLWLASRRGTDRDVIEQRAFDLFPKLRDLGGRTAGSLSGGEQQMLALARALAADPALLILDELSMGLAPLVVTELFACIEALADQGVAVVVVEQFARAVLAIATNAVVMLNGRIVQAGPPHEIARSLERAYLTGAAS